MTALFARFGLSFAATATVMVALDLLWLGVIAQPLYQRGIGHLMAAQPDLPVAVLFYLVYALGLVFFAVAPQKSETRWRVVLGSAALLLAINCTAARLIYGRVDFGSRPANLLNEAIAC